MKILMSAFAFSPRHGSEPGVGWSWAAELARTHDVTVLTTPYFRKDIEEVLATHPDLNMTVRYVELKPLFGDFGFNQMLSRLYYLRWQWHLVGVVRGLLAQQSFDLIHHITWGTLRYPSFLQKLGVPLVAGPLGGGERAPLRFYKGLPLKAKLREIARDLLIFSAKFDPIVRRAWNRTEIVISRTDESIAALPAPARHRAFVIPDIGAPTLIDSATVPPESDTLRCLFVGRQLGWKGVHLTLHAIKLMLSQGCKVSLTIVGAGEDGEHLRQLATDLQIRHAVTWVGTMPRDRVMQQYSLHDVFVFPSLHDSGGTVVLESLSQACPVLCLKLGGPPHFLDSHSGIVIDPAHMDSAQLSAAIAAELLALAQDRSRLTRMRQGALDQAQRHTWERRVAEAYEQVLLRLGQAPTNALGATPSRQTHPTPP
jgi:glycosyltransferase involved in cell wall biosynthesis